MAFVEADDGTKLWVEQTGGGSGLPLVLCHGGPGLWDNLAPLAALLDDQRLVVRWDQRGCGRSEGDAGPFTIGQFVADLESVRRGLGVARWIVGGHSWGATLALHSVLAKRSSAAALLYLSGTGAGRAWHHTYKNAARERLSIDQRTSLASLDAVDCRTTEEEIEWRTLRWAPDFGDRSRAMKLAAIDAAAPWQINYRCNADLNDEVRSWDEDALISACTSIEIPTLFLHGALDPRPTTAILDLVAAIPLAKLEVAKNVGHAPWLEQPEPVALTLRTWLAQVK